MSIIEQLFPLNKSQVKILELKLIDYRVFKPLSIITQTDCTIFFCQIIALLPSAYYM